VAGCPQGALEEQEELTRLRDEISAQRRELPWVRVGKNYDFHISFTREQIEEREAVYNYNPLEGDVRCEELPGFSVFYRSPADEIFHTYSGYARASDILIGTYNYLDHTPKGRNERLNMDWVRHHDTYQRQSAESPFRTRLNLIDSSVCLSAQTQSR
jgi:predicted dithiol-disulfide oxidoreductase (DUF899 family)